MSLKDGFANSLSGIHLHVTAASQSGFGRGPPSDMLQPTSGTCAQGYRLFLLTPSAEACGVETFTRTVAAKLRSLHADGRYALLSISGRWRDLPSIIRRIAAAETIVFNLPLVAWKRMLAIPLIILLSARILRCRVVVFMHEWSALHRLRRWALSPFIVLSHTIVVVSPFIRDQIASNPWFARAAANCRLVPHPPTVRRPQERCESERVQRVRKAANDCDMVIGCFGSIYKGKAAAALLEVCHHLRSRGCRPLMVFIGGFAKSLDNYEREFWSRASELKIDDRVIVTGYIGTETELYTLFEEMSAFLFLFPEGLTARRSSVIACLQSNRPIVVTAPHSADEFAHHEGFTALIEQEALSFIPLHAETCTIADRLVTVVKQGGRAGPAIDEDAWWRAAIAAVRAALESDRTPLTARHSVQQSMRRWPRRHGELTRSRCN